MKPYKFSILIFLLLLTALVSCKSEPTPDLTTQEIITEISREWWVVEVGEDPAKSYSSTISADSNNDNRIWISNFHGSNVALYAVINADYSIDLPLQTIDNQEFEGSINSDISNDFTRIELNYTIEYSGGTIDISATFTYGITS